MSVVRIAFRSSLHVHINRSYIPRYLHLLSAHTIKVDMNLNDDLEMLLSFKPLVSRPGYFLNQKLGSEVTLICLGSWKCRA